MLESLRRIADRWNANITDEELQELLTLDDFPKYFDSEEYEFNGNYILTDDLAERDEHVYQNMCCGIVIRDYKLKSGKGIYFAFDYGH